MFGSLLVLLGLLGLALALRAAAWLWYLPASSPLFGEHCWLPGVRRSPLGEGEAVEFTARDGVRLRGTYFSTPALRRHGVIVFCHELNADRWSALPYVADLLRRGFEVLAFDFRNHGASDRVPGYEPSPWASDHEVADVQAALAYVSARRDADPRGVGLVGVGRGAAAAVVAAAGDSRVRAVVVDSLCPTERAQVDALRRFLRDRHLPLRWMAWLPCHALAWFAGCSRWLLGIRRGCRFVAVEQAAREMAAPVLVIHAQADAAVPVEVVRAFCREALDGARPWIVPRAAHQGAILAAAEQYHRRVAQFLLDHLDARSPWENAPSALRPAPVNGEDRPAVPREVPSA